MALPLGFKAPENISVGRIRLTALIAAVTLDDQMKLAEMREVADDADAFDQFVGGIRRLASGDSVAAFSELARVQAASWRVCAPVLQVIALAANGELGQAFALAREIGGVVKASETSGTPDSSANRALLREGVRCLQIADAALPPATEPVQMASPFRYVVGYPRSGNTLLMQFLAFAFASPSYSVYAEEERYFSRRFYDRAPGHAVFVKDHVLRLEYLEDEILSPVRDGRNSMVSLARYLYAEGSSPFIRRGELADFLSYVAERMPYGFWGDHTRALLEARDRGARVRTVRYEEIFGNYGGLLALARELADGNPVPRVDHEDYTAFVARSQRKIEQHRPWQEGVPLPEDTFLPQNWSIGGGTIDWRRAFDAEASRRFHDLGGTEMLVRLGYETDENWWRQL